MKPAPPNLLRLTTGLLICAAFAATGRSAEAPPSRTPAISAERFQELEDAVRLLRQQNEQLRSRVEQLEKEKAGVSSAPATAPVETAAESKPRFVIPLGKEDKLNLGGFIQANAHFGDAGSFLGVFPDNPTGAANHTPIEDHFRLRRARINVSGDFAEQFDFKLEGDFVQGDGLSGNRTGFSGSDLFANWHRLPEANIKVGQYKAPFGMEQTTPDTTIFTAERSLTSGALTPERQIGVQVWGKPLARLAPKQKDLLDYAAGVFNGNNRNTVINDDGEFMYAGRLALTPFSGKLLGQDAKWKLGGNGFYSRYAAGTRLGQTGNLKLNTDGSLGAFNAPAAAESTGWGVDQWLTIGPFDLIAEYLEEDVQPQSSGAFADFVANGYYVQASYYFPGRKFQLVSKWESFNPGQAANDNIRSIIGGLNYYIKGNDLKLMLDYAHTWSDFRENNASAGRDEFDEVLLRMQLLF